jgi:hypothetical protein
LSVTLAGRPDSVCRDNAGKLMHPIRSNWNQNGKCFTAPNLEQFGKYAPIAFASNLLFALACQCHEVATALSEEKSARLVAAQ